MKVGFLGLGLMGSPMAMNIMGAGHSLSVYNRSEQKLRPFTEAGAEIAGTPAELAELCELVVTCVSDTADVDAVYFGREGILEGAHAGLVTVDCSTIMPDEERKIAERAASLGASHLDAPVSGGVKGAKAGTLAIMVGGDEVAFEKAKPVLDAMGSNVTYMGPSGSGQVIKLANQTVLAGNIMGLCEGLTLARKHGLDMQRALAVLSKGTASNWPLVNMGDQMLKGNWEPGFYVRHYRKDLSIVQSMARESNVCAPCSSLALSLYNSLASAEGGDELGYQALLKLFYELSGIGEDERKQ